MGTRIAFVPLRQPRGVTLVELSVTLALFGLIMVGVIGVWTKTQEAYFVGSEITEAQQNTRSAIDFLVRELRATGRDVTVCAFDYAGSGSLDCTSSKATSCQTRLGGSYTSCSGVFAIPFAQALIDRIQILADRNDNGTVAGTANASPSDEASENVLYALTSPCPPPLTAVPACITRDDGTGPVAMVAVNIQGFTLTYYPRSGFPPCVDPNPPFTPPYPCPPFTLPLTNQQQADNVGRINIQVTAYTTVAGQPVSRTLNTDVVLKNRY